MNAFMEYSQIFRSCRCHPARITKADKEFAEKFGFNDIKFPVKIRDIHELGKKNSISISVFGMKIKKNIQFRYQKNKKNMLIYF